MPRRDPLRSARQTQFLRLTATFNPRPVLCPTNVGRRRWVVIDMAHYRCFFVDTLITLIGSEDFHAVDDGGAIEIVMSLFRERNYRSSGFELWHGSRLVHRHPPINRRS